MFGRLAMGDPMSLKTFTMRDAIQAAKEIGIVWRDEKFGPDQLLKGMNVEAEHEDVTGGDPVMTAKIALAHLRERPDYYELLEMYVEAT